ncbi:hypothetical protein KP509_39G022500 [Ceratopteris richardii]|uniref:Uncharacterized protein n=1 Tax=Ceratopteris richardii TaxID=49495 RepID=A0A8T2PZW7_CERRI|nr:hypothetical protein KP509_39G022500 [Ceratopteris richardii]
MERHLAWLVALVVVLTAWFGLLCCGSMFKKKETGALHPQERPACSGACESQVMVDGTTDLGEQTAPPHADFCGLRGTYSIGLQGNSSTGGVSTAAFRRATEADAAPAKNLDIEAGTDDVNEGDSALAAHSCPKVPYGKHPDIEAGRQHLDEEPSAVIAHDGGEMQRQRA